MFRRERQFNIITGENSNQFIIQRARSCATQLQNYKKANSEYLKPQKLGIPKDKKQFKYSYLDIVDSSLPKVTKMSQMSKSHSNPNHTLMNYVSTGYNIINHTKQIETARVKNSSMFHENMPEVYKKSPLTEHIHRARMYAPNYHENYQKRTQRQQFHKRFQLCNSICNIQKTYGPSKYFRKFK